MPSRLLPITSTTARLDDETPAGLQLTSTSDLLRVSSTSGLAPAKDRLPSDASSFSPRAGNHRRGSSTIVIAPTTAPLQPPSTTSGARPSTSPSAAPPIPHPAQSVAEDSYFAIPHTRSGLEARSPANKRPPASRSSYGIETSSGPPPALSTQRNLLNLDNNNWRTAPPPLPIHPRKIFPKLTHQALAYLEGGGTRSQARPLVADVRSDPPKPANILEPGSPTVRTKSSIAIETSPHRLRDWPSGNEQRRDRGGEVMDSDKMSPHTPGAIDELQSQSSQEDFFLNLARTDTSPNEIVNPVHRDDRRRSRIAQSTHYRQTSRGTDHTSDSSTQVGNGNYEGTLQSPALTERRSSLQKPSQNPYGGSPTSPGRPTLNHRTYSSSAHPLEQRHSSRLTSQTVKPTYTSSRGLGDQDRPSEHTAPYGRGPFILESASALPPRGYRQSNLSYITNGHYHSSPLTNRASIYEQESSPTPRAEGTESTVSTTAPSTIFDELDDLKSRLRKLELTAKLPASSGAAISTATGERPLTATTTITTMSPSPNRGRERSGSPGTSVLLSPSDPSMHPLLHSALAKSKPSISPQVYRSLEAAAADALTLVKMASADRLLRRKADNMCRSLTELCITLSAEHPEVNVQRAKVRSASRDANSARFQRASSVEQPTSQRAVSQEPEENVTIRVLSRLEARRTSMLGLNGLGQGSSPNREPQAETATPTPGIANISGLNRTSTVLQRARHTVRDDDERPLRSVSRATTEIGQQLPPRRQSGSRNYLLPSQHPVSTQDLRSPTAQSSLPRRTYLSSTSQQPSTPSAQLGSRRYLERSTPSSGEHARDTDSRQQRFASFGQYNSAIRQMAETSGRRPWQTSVDPAATDGQAID